MNANYRTDKVYKNKRIMRAGGRISGMFAFVHVDCDNLDGGVLYSFARHGSGWKCYGFGRMRYASNPGRELFADKLPTYPPRQVERRDGKWVITDKATGEYVADCKEQG